MLNSTVHGAGFFSSGFSSGFIYSSLGFISEEVCLTEEFSLDLDGIDFISDSFLKSTSILLFLDVIINPFFSLSPLTWPKNSSVDVFWMH